jgi:myo-inositol 2-dehydrogenase / D-chiro-inositol 1-dehydrogenase
VKVRSSGAGRIGKVHARAIAGNVPDATLVAVADAMADAAAALAASTAPRSAAIDAIESKPTSTPW